MNKKIKLLALPIIVLLLSSCDFSHYFSLKDDDGESSVVVVESISFEQSSYEVERGNYLDLTVTFNPSTATDKTIIWNSSNTTVASIDSNGRVTANIIGTTTITARSKSNRSATATCSVEVVPAVLPTVEVESVTLNKKNLSLKQYESETLTATVLPSNATDKSLVWTTSDSSVAIVNNGVVAAKGTGNCTITAKSFSNQSITDTCEVNVSENLNGLAPVYSDYSYKDFTDNNYYDLASAPNVGNGKLLVIPVWFKDSSSYIGLLKRENVREDIQKAYFGTSVETGWESVKTFYSKDSFGKVNIDGVVSDWYDCDKYSSEFYSENSNATNELVFAAVEWYKEEYGISTLTDFDQDHDGYLDGVMLIYGAPDYSALSNPSASNLWAYCYWLQDPSVRDVANPGANVYFWASYDFMYSYGNVTNSRVGSRYGSGDQSHCLIDSHTFVHEMGHVFGLADYYDYTGDSDNKFSPAGAFSMQDHNVGAHDAFSRFALGWAKAYVPTETTTITVGAMENSGECILLSPSFSGSAFDEYILLELFTREGINESDAKYGYNYRSPVDCEYGVRVWHVDARLFSGRTYKLVTDPTGNRVISATSNTTYNGQSDANRAINYAGQYEYNQLHLIRNDTSAPYNNKSSLSSAAMFYTGDEFTLEKYATQFFNTNKLNNNKSLGWRVDFTSVSSSGMTLTCTKL